MVKENGNVGIGISDPQAQLHVSSNKAWAAYSDDLLLNAKIAATNADGNAFFYASDMSYDNSGHVTAGFVGIATAPDVFSFGIINEVSETVTLGVSGEGRMVINMAMDDAPAAQVDIRPLTGSETVLNVGDPGVFPLMQLSEDGQMSIGMPTQTNSALAVYNREEAVTNLDIFYHDPYPGALRFMNLVEGTPRHLISEDGSGNLLIDAGVTGGEATDKLKVDGDATITKTVGIGTDVQSGVALTVKGSSDTKLDLRETSSTVTDNAQLRFIGSDGTSVRHKITEDASGNLLIDAGVTSGGASDRVVFDGNVQIGTLKPTSSTYINSTSGEQNLSVNGWVLAKKVMVQTSNWADKVFATDYNLRSLTDIEAYIKQHNHLPEIPSECEVIEHGVDVGEMNKLLLQKVEELTLYVIAQQKQIDALIKK